MQVQLVRRGEPVHFIATDEAGHEVRLDGGPAVGGTGLGTSPMKLLLMALGGCAGIDIVSILTKGRQVIDGFEMTVEGERVTDPIPGPFRTVHVLFALTGAGLDPVKVRRAVDLSMKTYCSVVKTLEETATITYSVTVNGEPVEQTEASVHA